MTPLLTTKPTSVPAPSVEISPALTQAHDTDLVAQPAMRVWWLYVIVTASLLLIKFTLLLQFSWLEPVWRVGVALAAIGLAYLYLQRITTIYQLNAIELTGKVGVFSKRITRIPLNRITNYESHSSFFERLLGLSNLLIDTPGGASYELTLSQLCHRDAERFSARLRQLIAQQKIADAGSNTELRQLRAQALDNALRAEI